MTSQQYQKLRGELARMDAFIGRAESALDLVKEQQRHLLKLAEGMRHESWVEDNKTMREGK